jgi:hypothetical protein
MYGRVTQVTSPTVFHIDTVGLSDSEWVGHSVFVLKDASGTAIPPQNEQQVITAVNAISGDVTIGAPFTVPIAVGDEVLVLHPNISGNIVTGMQSMVNQLTDGVHLDVLGGSPGTAFPQGTQGHPVNNVADALAIMRANDINRLVLDGAQQFTGVHTAPNNPTIMTDIRNTFIPSTLIGLTIYNLTDGSNGVITANTAHTVRVGGLLGGGLNIWTTGDVYIIGVAPAAASPYAITFTEDMNLEILGSGSYHITISPTAQVTINGDLHCRGLTNQGVLTIHGKVDINGNPGAGEGNLDNSVGTLLSIGNHCHVSGNITNGPGNLFIYGTAHSINIANGAGGITIAADVHAFGITNITGPIQITGNLDSFYIEQTGNGSMYIFDNCKLSGHMTNSAAGEIKVLGKLDISGETVGPDGYLDNTGGGDITIGNDCHVSNHITNTTAHIYIQGNCFVGGVHAAHGTLTQVGAGHIYIEGNCQVDEVDNSLAGTIDIAGKLDVDGEGGPGGINNLDTARLYVNGDCFSAFAVANAGTLVILGSFRNATINNTGGISINGNCETAFVNNTGGGVITIYGKLDCGTWTNTGGGAVIINNNAFIAGQLTLDGVAINFAVVGNLQLGALAHSGTGFIAVNDLTVTNAIALTGAGTLSVYGNCRCANNINNSAGGTIEINGSLEITGAVWDGIGNFDNTGGGAVNIEHNCYVAGTITLTGAVGFTVHGNLVALEVLMGSSGAFEVFGDLQLAQRMVNSAGSVTIHGKADLSDWVNTGGKNVTINNDTHIGGTLTLDGTTQYLVNGNLWAVVITSTSTGGVGTVLEVRGNCQVVVLANAAGDFVLSSLQAFEGIDCTGGVNFLVQGDAFVGFGGFVSDTCNLQIAGNATIGGSLTTTTGMVTIYGDCHIIGQCESTDTGDIIIWGNLYVGGLTTMSAAGATLTVAGDAQLVGAISVSNGTASITVDGRGRFLGGVTSHAGIITRGISDEIQLTNVASANPVVSGTIFRFWGSIEILKIIGRVTTVIQNLACTVRLYITCDGLAAYNICDVSADIKLFNPGSLLSITGVQANPMVAVTDVGVIAPGQVSSIVATCVTSGVIGVTYSAGPTGVIQWEIQWRPLNIAGLVAV